MKRGRSTGNPTVAQQQRMDAITEIGCIVCDALGHGFMPCQVHHLLVGGKHGQPRRGHDFTKARMVAEKYGGTLSVWQYRRELQRGVDFMGGRIAA
ncbi:hypothetical protein D7Y26_09480 [Stenotrophomonas maltophilia]|nr:hypothetical protein [Stenotrophomonas maltophilia]MBA0323850.1 hypothetical protein [Stenotrophomonas maltophilia]